MKRIIIISLCLLVLVGHGMAKSGFAIVVDPKSYQHAQAELKAYAQAVEQVNGLKVYTVVDRWGIPDSIRTALQRLYYQKRDPIVGAVFVGDIPVPMIRDAQHLTSAFKMNQTNPRQESSVPSDRYYDDFSLHSSLWGMMRVRLIITIHSQQRALNACNPTFTREEYDPPT